MHLNALDSDENRYRRLPIRDKSGTVPRQEVPFSFPSDAHVFLRDPLVRHLVRETIYEVHNGLCFWTRSPLDKGRFAIDHVLPKSRNGPDNLFNLIPTSIQLNSTRGNAFETEAVIACLSIIRMTYGPRAHDLLRKKRREAGEPDGNWWCVEDKWIRRPRLIPYYGTNSQIQDLENSRTNIADLVRASDGGRWLFAIEHWLCQRRKYRGCLADIKKAWCSVATAIRSE